ncbi:MAG: hypothetical protein Q8L88_09775 [Bacteroidota bacterium]|nr:hypothetical protein [Bacteroidota bacterium]
MIHPEWVRQLDAKIINHIRTVHNQSWTSTVGIKNRVIYFYPVNVPILDNHNYPAYHFFVTNYYPQNRIFHCAAKCEKGQREHLPEQLQNLFTGNNVQIGHSGGGYEIGVSTINFPVGFSIKNIHQKLPNELWLDIYNNVLTNNDIVNFINLCAL